MKIKRNALLSIALLLAMMLSLAGCGGANVSEPPRATYMLDRGSIDEVCGILRSSGLRNTDIYKDWVEDFADTAGDADLPRGWRAPGDLCGDLYSCADLWEASHDFSDANCRMTAMLLLGDLIRVGSPGDTYDGTYLMMDDYAIENDARYAMLKERQRDFETIFGEMDIPEGGLADALPLNWAEHGISFDGGDNVSLISVVMEDVLSPVAFVGHAGVLIDLGDRLLFVEKLAFEQPYQATELHDIGELVDMLASRPEYFAEEGKEPSVICRNDEVIGKCKES